VSALEADTYDCACDEHFDDDPECALVQLRHDRDEARTEVTRLTKMLDLCSEAHEHNVRLKSQLEDTRLHLFHAINRNHTFSEGCAGCTDGRDLLTRK